MAMTPEVKAKTIIKRKLDIVLKETKLKSKLHWNGGGLTGTPRLDFDGVIGGHPFYIEVKRFDGKGRVTARQLSDINDYRKAGAFSMLIEDEASLEVFLNWVRNIKAKQGWVYPNEH